VIGTFSMKHTDVLKKKEARLLKHTGRKLVLKRRALNKALERAGLPRIKFQNDTGAIPPTLRTGSAPPSTKAPKKQSPRHGFDENRKPLGKSPVATVESSDPEWTVQPPEGKAFTVRATSEKAARAAARKALKIRALAAGTKVERQ
jgi:hypothetical protein